MKAQPIRPFRVLTMIKASMDRVLRERPWWTASSRVGFMGFTPKCDRQGGTKAGTGREEAVGGERRWARGARLKLEVEVEVPSGGTGRAGYGETWKACDTGETGETGRRFSDPRHPRHPRLKTRSDSEGPSAVGPHNIVRGEPYFAEPTKGTRPRLL